MTKKHNHQQAKEVFNLNLKVILRCKVFTAFSLFPRLSFVYVHLASFTDVDFQFNILYNDSSYCRLRAPQ